MKKKLFITLLLLGLFNFTFSQARQDISHIKSLFEGKWVTQNKYHSGLEIHFEPGKDYAIVTDIGTGEAPPIKLKAIIEGERLIILPEEHVSDYCEMEIQKKNLIFRMQPTVWDAEGNPQPPNRKYMLTAKFKRVSLK